MADQHIRAI